MAWTITSKSYFDTDKKLYYLNWSGQADASDLTDQIVVNVSDSPILMASSVTTIEYLRLNAGGVYARLEWDATTDDLIVAVANDTIEWPLFPLHRSVQVAQNFIKDPESSGTTGDILLTTLGGAAGDGVSIQLVIKVET